MKLICLILFVMTLFLWLLVMLGALPALTINSGWLGWFCCLFLGFAVFVDGGPPIKLG